ncbi:PhaM family polyhydroxyalkanoate granule multifunctional regulatory protein [Variovorax sp. LARHSF232]
MSDKPSFFFDQFVPGFDFLKNLATGASAGGNGAAGAAAKTGLPGMPGMPGIPSIPGISNWIAPTLSVEEVDKRIQELKAVQFWLEQNLHALKATIQALEVQKMTLSTLQGMNLRMEDLAKAFTGGAASMAANTTKAEKPPTAPKPEPAGEKAADKEEPAAEQAPSESPKAAAGAVDPMALWGALTQQFQQIATTALQEAAQLKMPNVLAPKKERAPAKKRAPAQGAKKAPARKRGSTTARQR